MDLGNQRRQLQQRCQVNVIDCQLYPPTDTHESSEVKEFSTSNSQNRRSLVGECSLTNRTLADQETEAEDSGNCEEDLADHTALVPIKLEKDLEEKFSPFTSNMGSGNPEHEESNSNYQNSAVSTDIGHTDETTDLVKLEPIGLFDSEEAVVVDEYLEPVSFGSLMETSASAHSEIDKQLKLLVEPYCFFARGTLEKLLCLKRCPFCEVRLPTLAALIEHLSEIHSNEGYNACSQSGCYRMFDSSQLLLIHLMESHVSELKFDCVICLEPPCDLEQMKVHLDNHEAACLLCAVDLKHGYLLEDHLTENHRDARNSYTCAFCDSKFRKANELLQHVRKHFGMLPFKCKICNRWFSHASRGLFEHINTVHKSQQTAVCPCCQEYKSSNINFLIMHWKNACSKFRCENCKGAYFLTRSGARYHQAGCRKSWDNFEKKCVYCCREFEHPPDLKAHILNAHLNGDTIRCDVGNCEHRSARFAIHWRHLVCVHGFSDSAKQNIKSTALAVESADKCLFPHCQFTSTAPSTLRQHVRKVHINPLAARRAKFLCGDCGFVGRDNYVLQRHQTSKHKHRESSYQCHHCEVHFPDASTRIRHMRRQHVLVPKKSPTHHSQSSPDESKCPTHHSQPSTDQSSYQCHHCEVYFPDASTRTRHMRRQHGLVPNKSPTHHSPPSPDESKSPTHHSQSSTDQSSPVQSKCPNRKPTMCTEKYQKYKCAKCNYQTHCRGHLTRHFSTQAHLTKDSSPAGDVNASKQRDCPLCNFVVSKTSSVKALSRHLFVHYRRGDTIPDGYNVSVSTCELCAHEFCDEVHLRRHLQVHAKKGDKLPEKYRVVKL